MNDILDKVVDVVKGVAPTVANLVMPGSGPLVHTLMRAVTGASDDTPIEEVAAQIHADPALMVELKRIAADREVRLAQIAADKEVNLKKEDTAQLTTVNETMQAEVEHIKHPDAGKWRPYWGMVSAKAFMLTVVGLVLSMVGAAWNNIPAFFNNVATIIFAITTLFGVPATILGVASWHRGVMQRVQAGEVKIPQDGMIVSAIKAFKGK